MTESSGHGVVEPPSDTELATLLRTAQSFLGDIAFEVPRGNVRPAQFAELADLLERLARTVRARAEVVVYQREDR
ncbi:hypothetical protein [Prauserella endophytica]|uniref:Uncharacterized protein n=1 Tax=Prauserella endophytica TaxID=1592324 RepID=A0ABY2RZZ3_9PSEU|nr:hypothetical protein [Prauserella endophytica]PXY20303.1 hypothetical protein BAY59_31175 [Prauserella coralliicola]TKG66906.1 hypothetical protein FCN18_23620 [Prauserella endophytica]